MRDVIRLGADSIHYLAVFDGHSERPLYLSRQARIATTDQRIICYARDGGCTRPNCLSPGYHAEVHHSPDWTPHGATDADKLFFACPPDHYPITTGHYRTTVTDTGRPAWTDTTTPPDINHEHYPEELLRGNTDPPENCDDDRRQATMRWAATAGQSGVWMTQSGTSPSWGPNRYRCGTIPRISR
jgi:hypothetical protein